MIKLGDWREVLADVEECDAVICDPPYGARTHDGHDDAVEQVKGVTGQAERRALSYSCWTRSDVSEFVEAWKDRNRGWFACLTSHDLIPAWEDAYQAAGLYSFAPVPWISKRPRLLGDGPSSWACYAMVARPRNEEFLRWGCLPGAYLPFPGSKEQMPRIGGKPVWLMRAIVRDYTRPGDLVVDPCAGAGTTLIAAEEEGRRAIGAEIDPEAYEIAAARLGAPVQRGLF